MNSFLVMINLGGAETIVHSRANYLKTALTTVSLWILVLLVLVSVG